MKKNDITIIKLSEFGDSVGTRELGNRIRERVSSLIEKGSRVLISFKGISIISSAFADEVFGKLFVKLGEEKFKETIKVNDFDNPEQKNLILLIIQKGISFRRHQPQGAT